MMRILLITRHYPPAVSGGAKRPFLLARELRKLGCEIFVIAPSLPDGEIGVAEPHPHRDPATSSGGKPNLRALARELLLWPDPDIRWTQKAAQTAIDQTPWRPDWVWTTSPPESIHAAGVSLKKHFGAKWMADFRDHWLDRPHRRERATFLRRAGERLIARRWLAQADLVTSVDPFIADELRLLGPVAPQVTPHFSPSDPVAPINLPAEDINVVHTGAISLSDPQARIEEILAPFEQALMRNPALKLHLVGRLTDQEVMLVQASPICHRILMHGVQPLETALGHQHAADALIFVGSGKTRVPPSKITEYLATDAPIIACGDGDWRSDPRVDNKDPSEALIALRQGDKRTPLIRAPSVAEVAAQLLSKIRSV
jgi:glycosyltransferase involved in cell wall biosynthesis